MKYDEFTLVINQVAQYDEIRATWNQADGGRKPERADLRLAPHERDITRYLIGLLRYGKLEGDEEGLRLLGESLYRALFPEHIDRLFREAVDAVRRQQYNGQEDKRLRVLIEVESSYYQVANWPLEFLRCTAEGGYWLATAKDLLTLSRRLIFPGQKVEGLQHYSPPLRVLVVVSKPRGESGVMTTVIEDIAKWAAKDPALEVKLLGRLEERELVTGMNYLNELATFGNISREIIEFKPHVLHFIGHGKTEKYHGCLGLVNSYTEKVEWCSASDFLQLLTASPLRLVVLQACESAMDTTGSGFMSLAAYLVQRNIPAVVAMQFEIRNIHATDFASGFYAELARGVDVDVAVQTGRWNISFPGGGRWQERHFGTPVLFVINAQGIISPVSPGSSHRQPRGHRRESGRAQKPVVQPNQASDDRAKRLKWLEEEAQEAEKRGNLRDAETFRRRISDLSGAKEVKVIDDGDDLANRSRQVQKSSTGRLIKRSI